MDISYYDKFSKIYDLISSKYYYRKPRRKVIEEMRIQKGDTILNLPVGTGQNFEYFQRYLVGLGQVIGIDLSEGMLNRAKSKIQKKNWKNIKLFKGDATDIDPYWVSEHLEGISKFDSIVCDLGLSGFPESEKVIDNMISILKPGGRLVIMDWYIESRSLRGEFIKWVGKGEVNRPLFQYMKTKVSDFSLDQSFKGGQMFVATGVK